MIWIFAALCNSLLAAANAEINRRFQQEPFRLNLWRTLLASLIWLPLAMLQDWPTEPLFYTTAVFCGLTIIIGNMIMNDLSARMNGRVAVLHIPIKAILVFCMWPLVDEAARNHMLNEEPWQVMAGLMFFGIMVVSINAMRSNDASWSALRALVPVIILYSASDIAGRLVLDPQHLNDHLIVYLFIATGVSAVFSLALYPWRPRPELPLVDRKMLQAAGWAGVISTLNHTCFFIGLALAPNPAYVSMIALIAPAWLFLYHRVFKIPDNASPWASMVLIMGAIGLLVVTL